jgi:general secretion pathway protein A
MAATGSLYDLYFQHFSLTEAPFSISPNPRYLYLSLQHKEAFAHLLYGIGANGGFTVLTGEVGTGKTTLCRALLDDPPEGVDLALVFNPCLDSLELLATICDELGVHYPTDTQSIKTLNDCLNRYLLDAHAQGRRPIVLVDEAQNLRLDVLEQIRLLTNLETHQTKLLQIILVGQPELNELLAQPKLRQLSQRITARYHLEPLSLAETGAYIAHRLSVAGAGGKVFSPRAIRTIYRKSRGIPRVINLISDRALLGAYSKHQSRVDAATVQRAALELLFPRASFFMGRPILRWALIGLLGIIVLGLTVATHVDWTGDFLKHLRGIEWPASFKTISKSFSERSAGSVLPRDEGVRAQDPNAVTLPQDLDTWLMATGFSRGEALRQLESIWGLKPESFSNGCGSPPAQGVQCSEYRDSWVALVRMNHPVVLELQRSDGLNVYATMVSLRDGRARLVTPDGSVDVQADQIVRRWVGNALILWRSSMDRRFRPLRQGMKSPVIAWVRQQLNAPEGGHHGLDIYDLPLKQAVMAFQRQCGIEADGLIGDWTMTSLEVLGRDEAIPRLDVTR